MKATEPLPVIRVTRPKAGAPRPPASPPIDIRLMDTLVKIVDNAGRLRGRMDGLESRIKYLEALLEHRGSR